MSFKTVGGKKYVLSGAGISSSDTSIILASFKLPVSDTNITMTDFGDTGYGVLEPGTSRQEFISFTGVTQNANGTATLTGVTRGLKPNADYTSDNAYKIAHSGGTSFILSNPPQLYEEFVNLDNAQTIVGKKTFPAGGDADAPVSGTSYSAPTDDLEYATKKYIDDIAIAGSPLASTTTQGIGKTSVAPASPTDPIFVGDNDPRVPTSEEKDALVGTSGVPSSSNRFVTEQTSDFFAQGVKSFTAGESLLENDAVSLKVEQSVAFYNSDSKSGIDVGTSDISVTFDVGSDDDRILIVYVIEAGNNPGSIGSPSYNGVAMTSMGDGNTWYMKNPPAGENTLLITRGNTSLSWVAWAGSGFDQSQDVEFESTDSGDDASPTGVVDVEKEGSLVVSLVEVDDTGSISAVSNATIRGSVQYYDSVTGKAAIADSNGSVSAGELTTSFSALSDPWTVRQIILKPQYFSDGKAYKSDASDAELAFLGFTKEAIASESSGKVNSVGIMDGFTDLIPGLFYYLTDTPGEIGLVPGTISKIVGKAISTTELLIINNAE